MTPIPSAHAATIAEPDLLTADGATLYAEFWRLFGKRKDSTITQDHADWRDAIVRQALAAAPTPGAELTEGEAETAREVRRSEECETYIRSLNWFPETSNEVRSLVIGNIRSAWSRGGDAREAELTALGRSRVSVDALREAASKAWDAAWSQGAAFKTPAASATMRDRYLAREYPEARRECVLSDGATIEYSDKSDQLKRRNVDGYNSVCDREFWPSLLNRPSDTGADFDKLKAFAATLTPEAR